MPFQNHPPEAWSSQLAFPHLNRTDISTSTKSIFETLTLFLVVISKCVMSPTTFSVSSMSSSYASSSWRSCLQPACILFFARLHQSPAVLVLFVWYAEHQDNLPHWSSLQSLSPFSYVFFVGFRLTPSLLDFLPVLVPWSVRLLFILFQTTYHCWVSVLLLSTGCCYIYATPCCKITSCCCSVPSVCWDGDCWATALWCANLPLISERLL